MACVAMRSIRGDGDVRLLGSGYDLSDVEVFVKIYSVNALSFKC